MRTLLWLLLLLLLLLSSGSYSTNVGPAWDIIEICLTVLLLLLLLLLLLVCSGNTVGRAAWNIIQICLTALSPTGAPLSADLPTASIGHPAVVWGSCCGSGGAAEWVS